MTHRNVILVDGGNMFLSAGLLPWLKAQAALSAMAAMEYTALNIGHTDFVFGDEFILKAFRDHGLPFVSSNLIDNATRTPLVPDHRIVSCGPVRVGIIGVVAQRYQETVAKFNAGGRLPVGVLEEIAAIQEKVAALEGLTDIIVVLADTGLSSAKQLAENISGVHIIISSSGYDQTDSPILKNGIYIVKAGSKGEGIGRLEICFDDNNNMRSVTGSIIALTENLPENEGMLSIIDDYHTGLKEYADELIKIEQVPPTRGWHYTGADVCAMCHISQSGQWRSTGHQKAFTTLVERNQQYNPECIACHITGYGYIGGFDLPETTPERGNVQCEMCHGPGGEHAATLSTPYGEIAEDTCLDCHTEDHSPDFEYEKYKKKISHDNMTVSP